MLSDARAYAGWLLRLVFVLWALFFAAVADVHAEVAVPPLRERVVDLSGVLDPTQIAQLQNDLRRLEQEKGSQIVVLLLPTTQPETIEQYALRVVEQWKLGRKGVDDGVLLIVAMQDRTMRIEVGYGLEGAIPDVVAKRVIAEVITPYFKRGDIYGGLQAGVNQLSRLIQGESLPAPEAQDKSWSGFEQFIPFAFIFVMMTGGLFRALFGPVFGALIAGTVTGGLFWLFAGSLLGSIIAGVVAFIFVLGVTGSGRGGGGGDYWVVPGPGYGRSSGSWGGGDYGRDDFGGGGGGSFGGGGASGQW